jgi:hypothetical protein
MEFNFSCGALGIRSCNQIVLIRPWSSANQGCRRTIATNYSDISTYGHVTRFFPYEHCLALLETIQRRFNLYVYQRLRFFDGLAVLIIFMKAMRQFPLRSLPGYSLRHPHGHDSDNVPRSSVATGI